MQTDIHLEKIFHSLTHHIIRRRWWYLVVVALLTVFFFSQMSKIRFDSSPGIWLVEDHPYVLAEAHFDETFGNDDFVYLLFTQEQTPFTPENFRLMGALAEAFEQSIPYLKNITWLGNAERIRGKDGEAVEIENFFPTSPQTKEEIATKLDEALTEPSYVSDLISPDKTALTMILELGSYPDKEEDLTPQKTVVDAVDAILAQPHFAPLAPWLLGSPHHNIRYSELVKGDMGKLFSLVIVIQMVLLFFFARGLRGVVVPLLITVLSVFWTLGSIGLLGITLNLLSSALPTMLICISIGDAMHAISAFYGGMGRGLSRKEALAAAFAEVGRALVLTSLTTAIGFLAYLSCDVVPYREMGIYVAIGVLYAVILTFILTPALYSFGKDHLKEQKKQKERGETRTQRLFSRWLTLCYRLVTTRPKLIVFSFSAIMLLTFVGYLNMKVESNTAKLIFKGEPLRDTLDLIDARMGTASTLEFLIDAGRESGIKDPEFMQKLDTLMRNAEKHPLVTKATSVTTVIKQMRRALHNNDPAYYSLPESAEAMAQYLFLYESSGGNMLDRQVGFLYDVARLTIKTPSLDTADSRRLMADMRTEVERLFGDSVEVIISGGMARYLVLNDILYEGQRQSFLAALLAIAVVMMVVLRSVKLGLLSLIPNIFPVFLTMGFLGLVGYYLDVITVSFAAVIIGVAVDDTIHFFTRFRQEFSRIGRYNEALKATYLSVGHPLTQTTIVLVVGNAALLFSSILGFYKLGLLFGVAFSAALLADLLFAPALIVLLKPLGKETPPELSEKEVHHA